MQGAIGGMKDTLVVLASCLCMCYSVKIMTLNMFWYLYEKYEFLYFDLIRQNFKLFDNIVTLYHLVIPFVTINR